MEKVTKEPFKKRWILFRKNMFFYFATHLWVSSMIATCFIVAIFATLFMFRMKYQQEDMLIDWRKVRMEMTAESQVEMYSESSQIVSTNTSAFPTRDQDWTPADWERCGCDECMRNFNKYQADQMQFARDKQADQKKAETNGDDTEKDASSIFQPGGNLDPFKIEPSVSQPIVSPGGKLSF